MTDPAARLSAQEDAMTTPDPQASAPRMVMVNAEALETALLDVFLEGEPAGDWCRACGRAINANHPHATDCPVPVLQAALTLPQPQPGGPGVAEVLGMVADWREAAERRNALRNSGKVNRALTSHVQYLEDRVLELQSVHLRALAQSLTPAPAPDELRVGVMCMVVRWEAASYMFGNKRATALVQQFAADVRQALAPAPASATAEGGEGA